MTNTPSTNAQHSASSKVPQRKDWTAPVLDILALANAEHGISHVADRTGKHKSG
jgi:hypothetical protein